MPMTTASLPPQVQHAPVAFVKNRGQGSAQAVYQSSALGYRLEKLNLQNSGELVRFAIRNGLIH